MSFGDAPVMLGNFGLDEDLAQRREARVRTCLVDRHQPRVADHVRSRYSGQPARHRSGPMRNHADDSHKPLAKTSAERDTQAAAV
jgi:hypothetical protein